MKPYFKKVGKYYRTVENILKSVVQLVLIITLCNLCLFKKQSIYKNHTDTGEIILLLLLFNYYY